MVLWQSALASLKRLQRRRGGALAPLRTVTKAVAKPEVAPPAACREHGRYGTAQVVEVVHSLPEPRQSTSV